jgi:VCBS repeat-containing protein
MLLLFLAQAILSACGGGGGGGGNKPGPVLKGSPAPLPAKTESTPPEPATKPVVKGNPAPLPAKTESSPPEPVTEPELKGSPAPLPAKTESSPPEPVTEPELKGKPAPLPAKTESSPPEPAPEPVSVSPPVSSPKPLSVESPSSIVNHSNRPVVQLVQQFEEELPSESDDDAAEQPWFFAIPPEAASSEASTVRFFLMAVAIPQDDVVFSLVMPDSKEGAEPQEQSEEQSDHDNDLVDLFWVNHNDPNVRAAILRFSGDAFDFESDRVRDRDGSPHFLVKVMATRSTNTKIKTTEPMTLELKLLIANRPDEAITVDALTGLSVAENGTALMGTAQLSYTTAEANPDIEYRLVGGAVHDYVTVSSSGAISLNQAPDYEAVQTITFRVEARHVVAGQDDDAGWQGARDITIAVEDRDEAPTGFALGNARANLAEDADTSARIRVADLTVTDPDTIPAHRQHSFTLSGTHAAMFEVEGASLYLKAGAALDHETVSALDVRVTLTGTALSADYRLAIANRPDEAVVVTPPQPMKVAENAADGTQIGQLTATTVEAGDKIIRFEKTGGHAALAVASDGTITTTLPIDFDSLTPDQKASGIALAVRAVMTRGDETVISDTVTTHIHVENRNDLPLSLDARASVTVDETLLDTGHNVLATVTDAAGAPVVYAITGGADAALFEVDQVNGRLRFRVAPDHETPSDRGRNNIYEVEVTATSASTVPGDATQTATQTVRVTVTGHFGRLQLHSDGRWTYTLDDTNGNVNGLKAGESITERFAVRVHDGQAFSDIVYVTISIKGANDAPDANSDTAGPIDEGAIVTGNVLTNDTDVDTAKSDLHVVGIWKGSGAKTDGADTNVGQQINGDYGTLTLNADGGYTYTANTNANQTATDIFTYEVSDRAGGTDTATLQITVNGVAENAPPARGKPGSFVAVNEGDKVVLTVVDFDNWSDAEGDEIHFTNVNASIGFIETSEDGTTWTRATTFTLTQLSHSKVRFVHDGSETTFSQISYMVTGAVGDNPPIFVNVTPVNDAPLVDDDVTVPQQAGNPGGAITPVDFSRYFTEVDTGDSLTYTFAVTNSGGGAVDGNLDLSIDASTGRLTGTLPASNVAAGNYTVTVTATDTGGLLATKTFTLTVNDVDPVAANQVDDREIEAGGNFAEINFSGYFTDGNGDSLTYGLTVLDSTGAAVSGSGLTIDRNTGLLTATGGTLDANLAAGAYTVSVNASDGLGTAATISFTINVTAASAAVDQQPPPPAPVVPNPVVPPAQPQAPADATFGWVTPTGGVGLFEINGHSSDAREYLFGYSLVATGFGVDMHANNKLKLADVIFGFEQNLDTIQVHDTNARSVRADRTRDVDGDGNLDTIIWYEASNNVPLALFIIDNFTDENFGDAQLLSANGADRLRSDADPALAPIPTTGSYYALNGSGKGRDYLIGRDGTADEFSVDLRNVAENTGGKSKTADGSRFANADLIHNFDVATDKIKIRVDDVNLANNIRVDDRFNIIGAAGDEADKKDAIIFEATGNRVLAVLSDVGTGVNWSTVDFVDFTDADLSDPVKADLPDIS